MGLDIITSDYEKDFHIGYMGFTRMREYFVLNCGEELYDRYVDIVTSVLTSSFGEIVKDDESFYEEIGDLNILISHSDCDGELSVDECKKLKKVLIVNEEKIKNEEGYKNNPQYVNRMISKMYEFIELINYAVDNNVKLLFG